MFDPQGDAMVKRAGFSLPICFLLAAGFLIAGCSSNPANFNTVVLTATALSVGPNQVVTITAAVPADTTNAGVTWAFTPGAGAPANPGTFTSTLTSATYTSPASVSAKFTVAIQATSIAIPAEVNSVTITINPPQPLAIKTTSLPNGVQNVVYAGAQLQATGGVTPYTWTLVNATTLPANLSLSSSGAISGTPTTVGNFSFTVQVSDNESTPMTQQATLSITVTNLLSGNYAFEFSGFNSGGAVVVAGNFTTDGVSKITAGVEDSNSISGTPKNQTFTGTYTLGADDRGQLVFSSLAGSPTYDFTLDATGVHGRLIEFDSTGVRGSGELAQQTTSTCGSQTLSGPGPLGNDFVVGLTGAQANVGGATPGPFALAGRITAEVPASSTTPGTLDNGEADASAPGDQLFSQSSAFSGTFQTSSQAGRCTMALTVPLGSMNFGVYPVSFSNGLLTEAYVVETDTVSASSPFVSVGRMMHQTGYPFSAAIQSFSAASVGGLAGPAIPNGQSAYVPFAAAAQIVPQGGTGFTLSLVDNVGGTVGSALGSSAIAASFNTGDSYGRVDTDLLTPIDPVFYLINNNEALCLLENVNAPVLGIFEAQSMGSATSFTAGTIAETLIEGTSAPAASTVQNFSGFAAFTNTNSTSGTLAGTQDLSTSSANSSGLAISGTYALTSTGQTDGSGTLSLTQTPPPPVFNGAFFIVSPTKAVMITTTTGDTNPVLTIVGDEADDFGVN
jgi:Putative Ig domain